MQRNIYALKDTAKLISPALVYYKDIILENTLQIIKMAGGPEQLWPHVKSHKTTEMIRMQIELGITRFKCATIAEAEITAEAGAAHLIFAYPLIGPNIERFLKLARDFSQTVFYAIGDDLQQLSLLSEEACRAGMSVNFLVDTDLGMHRTGVPLDLLESFCERASALKGIKLKGLHCYDGHCHGDPDVRKAMVDASDRKVLEMQALLRKKGHECDILVMGGTPAFPCRAGKTGFYLSPGTLFLSDGKSTSELTEVSFTPGAALFCRVVSHCGRKSSGLISADNIFTIDLGCKGISTDQSGDRGAIAGLPEARPVLHSEEHWVFSLPEGMEPPAVGSECYVIPAHICPTSALYPEIQIAQGGKITGQWQVGARNRKIKY